MRNAAAVLQGRAVAASNGGNMNIVTFKLPAHTDIHGPVCRQMAKYLAEQEHFADLVMDPMNDYAGFVPDLPDPTEEECSHWTCLAMIYEDCIACEIEAQMEENDQVHYIVP